MGIRSRRINFYLVLDSLSPISPFSTWQIKPLDHKATFLYWPVSGQHSQFIVACFYKELFRYHDEHSDIEFDHFIASSFPITSNGPSTLPQILDAHRDVIDQGTGSLSNQSNSWLKATKYSLLSLYQAVILVLHDLGPDPEPVLMAPSDLERNLRDGAS